MTKTLQPQLSPKQYYKRIKNYKGPRTPEREAEFLKLRMQFAQPKKEHRRIALLALLFQQSDLVDRGLFFEAGELDETIGFLTWEIERLSSHH